MVIYKRSREFELGTTANNSSKWRERATATLPPLFTICMLYNVFNKWNCFVYLVKTSHYYPTKILEGDRSYLMEMTTKYRSNKP